MGHGPHTVGGVEFHAGRPIFYSLGNFVFDWDRMRGRHREGLVLECRIEDRRLRGVTVRVVQRGDDNDPRLIDGHEVCSPRWPHNPPATFARYSVNW